MRRLAEGCTNFSDRIGAFLSDRYGALHFLQPVLNRDPSAFFTNGDDKILQRQWAHERGMPRGARLDSILLAQIEDHRTEVFYNLDPVRYDSDFVRKLPGCVRTAVAWRAAPSPGVDLGAYNLIVCNFPGIIESYRRANWKAAYFVPAHDPVMDSFAQNCDRPIDILFVGAYTRHHRRRAELLEAVATLGNRYQIALHLDRSRLTKLAETPLGRLFLARHRRPEIIKAASSPAIFGLDLYRRLSSAKVVLNCAIDMAGQDRGNLRCFESTGCACALLSDSGNYPRGMIPGQNMITYDAPADAVKKIHQMLSDTSVARSIAAAGYRMVKSEYSKTRQMEAFIRLVG